MTDYLKIKPGESATVKLLGPPQEYSGRYGKQFNFPIEHGGKEMVWTATLRAKELLEKDFAPGDRVRIENKVREEGGSVYLFHTHTFDQGTSPDEDRITGMARYMKKEFDEIRGYLGAIETAVNRLIEMHG